MIDIIITNYNNGWKLWRCLESVARQTIIDNIRVILVDDFSDDDSAIKARLVFGRLCGKDIIVINNDENLGAGMSGVRESTRRRGSMILNTLCFLTVMTS